VCLFLTAGFLDVSSAALVVSKSLSPRVILWTNKLLLSLWNSFRSKDLAGTFFSGPLDGVSCF
jgi:hypothetical protein